ncbi:hypothetical protein CFE70_006274 [Pyrenophora teres f. teres 0-1]
MCSKEKSRNNAHLAYPTAIRSALRSKVQGIAAVRYNQASTITPPSIKTMHITILPPKLRHSASPAITIALRNILVSDLPGSSHTPVTANP